MNSILASDGKPAPRPPFECRLFFVQVAILVVVLHMSVVFPSFLSHIFRPPRKKLRPEVWSSSFETTLSIYFDTSYIIYSAIEEDELG